MLFKKRRVNKIRKEIEESFEFKIKEIDRERELGHVNAVEAFKQKLEVKKWREDMMLKLEEI